MATTVDPVAIGIKKIMTEKGLLQRAVAKRAGFSEQQFSAMMNDRKIIRACDLIPISEALEVEVSEILAMGMEAHVNSEQRAR